MAPLSLPTHHWSIQVGRLTAGTEAVGPFRRHRGQDRTVLGMVGHPSGCHWTSRPIPIWRVIPVHAVGTPIPGHDVSGTGWQTLGDRAREGGRAMESITTM